MRGETRTMRWVGFGIGGLMLATVWPVCGQTPAYPSAIDSLRAMLGDSIAGQVDGYRLLRTAQWYRDVDAAARAWAEAGVPPPAGDDCLRTPLPPLPPIRPRPGGLYHPDGAVTARVVTTWGRLFESGASRCPDSRPVADPLRVRDLAESFRLELEDFRRAAEAARADGAFADADYWGWIVLYREGLGIYRGYLFERVVASAAMTMAGDAWERRADLLYPVRAPAVATDGERIFVFGGSARGNVRVSHTQIYTPEANRWTLGAPMPEPRDWSSVVLVEGRFHVLGGVTDRVAASDAHWIYDPALDAWEVGATMPSPAAGAATAVVDGRVFVLAGIDGPRAYSARVRVYDVEARTWSAREDAPAAKLNWQAAAIDGVLWVGGGSGPGRVTGATLYRYDPVAGAWSSHAPLLAPNEGYGGAEVSGRYCTVGGRVTPRTGSFNTSFDRAECFDPAVGEWSRLPPLPTAVQEAGAVGLGGMLYVVGGRISFDGMTGEVYRLRVGPP